MVRMANFVMCKPQLFKMSVQYDYTYVKQTHEKNLGNNFATYLD